MPMVAEKEYQYGADAFEAFQSTEKAKEMASKMAVLEKGAVKSSKSR